MTTHPEPLRIPVSDGVELAAVRWPADRSPAPAVVTFTPYRKERLAWLAPLIGALGCDLVAVDVRGLGGSAGHWQGPLSEREATDGAEALEWIAARPSCTGSTALVGASYAGANQLLIAARRPRGLRCIAPAVVPVDVYRDMWHRGGIPSHASWGARLGAIHGNRTEARAAILGDFYGTWSLEPLDGTHCRRRSPEEVVGEIEVPALVTGGWYDYFLRGTLRAFGRLRSPTRLVVGAWCHEDIGAVRPEELSAWLGYWLGGRGADPTAAGNVVLQAVGTDAWTASDRWPTAAEIDWWRWLPVARPTRLAVLGTLADAPAAVAFPLGPGYDLPTDSGMHLWGESWAATSPALAAPARLRGPVALHLVLVSEQATDIDVHARVSIVRPDRSILPVSEGRLRSSHRALDAGRCAMTGDGEVAVAWHPHDHLDELPLGAPVSLEVEVFPINVELAAGESVRLGLTLVRADEEAAPATARLLPETRLLLPGL